MWDSASSPLLGRRAPAAWLPQALVPSTHRHDAPAIGKTCSLCDMATADPTFDGVRVFDDVPGGCPWSVGGPSPAWRTWNRVDTFPTSPTWTVLRPKASA